MPAFLKLDEDRDLLYVRFAQMSSADFQDAKARVRSIAGSRWNPGEKRWDLPNDPDTALRVMQMIQPTTDAAVQSMVRERSAEVATQLITRVGEDADLRLSYADALFPYQRAGVDFLAEHPRSILGDEMGVGKTLQAVGTVDEFDQRRGAEHLDTAHTLVVCPKPVRSVWVDTFEQGPLDEDRQPIFHDWPGRAVQVIDGRRPAARLKQLSEPEDPDTAVWVVNWESFWREPLIEHLRKRPWRAVIADEAHRAKNRKAKQSRGLRKLHAPLQLALTGTPIMNTPDELWALLAWLRPEQYTSFWAFHNSYVDEYIAGYNQRVMIGVRNADKLRFELSDKMIRRRKVDVLKDLPEKMPTQVIHVELSPAERKLYQETEKALILDVATHIEHAADDAEDDDLLEPAERKAWIEQRADELAHMPLDRLKGLVPNAGARLAKLRQITAAAKVAVANELIRDEPETPVVAFTWHVDAARQLADALSKGQPPLRVGTIAGNDDPDPVKDAFQTGDLDHVVCTISKGGTGLTLTRSSNPLFVEEDWTPAINDQATDRTHRIGQTEPVTPRVLRCVNTVDDGKVAPRNEFKRSITAQVLGE